MSEAKVTAQPILMCFVILKCRVRLKIKRQPCPILQSNMEKMFVTVLLLTAGVRG